MKLAAWLHPGPNETPAMDVGHEPPHPETEGFLVWTQCSFRSQRFGVGCDLPKHSTGTPHWSKAGVWWS